MLERQLTGKIGKALRDDTRFKSGAYEIKLARTNTLSKGEVKEHQLRNLQIAKNNRLYYKIADVGYDQKPFDIIILKNSDAYLVIYYQKAHELWAIDVSRIPDGKITLDYARENGLNIDI